VRCSGVGTFYLGRCGIALGICGACKPESWLRKASYSEVQEAKADLQCPIDPDHGRRVESPETPHQSLAVNGTNLAQLYSGWRGLAVPFVGRHDHLHGVRYWRQF
jgi:hypothetical protein